MIKRSFDLLVSRSPLLRRFMIRRMYQVLTRLDRHAEMVFMNYGYADLDGGEPVPLDAADEPNRYAIQMYRHLADAVELRGRRVLEVGSGRGGGAAYVAATYGPAEMVGLDVSGAAVEFCRRHHRVEGLRFVQGDAEALPFQGGEFDVILNVESSHGYGSPPGFFREVHRVLRPGGHFLYTDHRNLRQMVTWRDELEGAGLRILEEREITPNVVRALELDHPRKESLIRRRAPRFLRNAISEFAALHGSAAHGRFAGRTVRYHSFVCRKES